MIGLRIGVAELREIEAGAPCVVLAPGLVLPHAPPLVPLVLKDGVLARPGAATDRTLPVPHGVRPLALVAPPHHAERLAPLLPAGLPVMPDAHGLLGLLAAGLREAGAARDAAAAERDRLKRALGRSPPQPRLVAELPPVAGAAASLPQRQPLGRPAEGLCTVEIHLLAAGTAGLRARLLAGDHVVGAWDVPAAALAPGWLALDLPEPAPFGPAEAVLDLLATEGTPPVLAAADTTEGAPLAIRLLAAGPGWAVLPRHVDWHALGAVRPALPLPVPPGTLAEAVATGGTAELIGAGTDAPRLMLGIAPGEEALLELPQLAVGPADLLRAELTLRGAASDVAASLGIEGEAASVATGWRPLAGSLQLALALPPGSMVRARVQLRNAGALPATIELGGLALQAGAAGEPRRAPTAEAAALPRPGIALPGLGAEATAWRAGPPAPRLGAVGPGGVVGGAPVAVAAPLPAPTATVFQDLKVNQHLVNGDGSYRHLDINLAGLVSGGGLWRQLRVKLFDRRGTTGLEFREIKGWPQMFDAWPAGKSDQYGPFWRLENEAPAEALAALATPHDRAMIAALLEILPEVATRAALSAGLAGAEAEAWSARAQRLVSAVTQARGIRPPG
jgi:hypothetical protein